MVDLKSFSGERAECFKHLFGTGNKIQIPVRSLCQNKRIFTIRHS
jgi:hypothetical protein